MTGLERASIPPGVALSDLDQFALTRPITLDDLAELAELHAAVTELWPGCFAEARFAGDGAELVVWWDDYHTAPIRRAVRVV